MGKTNKKYNERGVWLNLISLENKHPWPVLTADQDAAAAQREALHGLSQQYQGNGKDSAPRIEVSPRYLKKTYKFLRVQNIFIFNAN